MYDHIRIELLFFLLRTNIWWDTVCKAAASKKWWTHLYKCLREFLHNLYGGLILSHSVESLSGTPIPMPHYNSTPQVSSIQWDKHKSVLVKVQRRAAQYHTTRKTIPWETYESEAGYGYPMQNVVFQMISPSQTHLQPEATTQSTYRYIPLWNRRPETVASATSLEDFRSKLVEIHILKKPQQPLSHNSYLLSTSIF